MTAKKLERIGMAQMAVCAFMWSIAGIFIKLLDWNPFVIAGYRSFLAAVTVFLYMRLIGQKLKVSRNTVTSMFFVSATFLCFVTANKMTTAANAIVLQFTAPIFILIYSALFCRQPFARSDYVTVLCTFGGIGIFFLGGLSQGNLFGNLLSVLAGVALAGTFLSVNNAGPEEKLSGILLGHLLTAAIGITVSLFRPATFSPQSVASILILGILQSGIPYILMGLASATCPPLACCLIGAVEPLLNPVWVFLFDGEKPGVTSVIGGIIVIASVTAHCILRARRTAAPTV